MADYAKVGIIVFAVIMYEIMAVPSHSFHHNTAFGERRFLAFRIDDNVGMVDAVIIQGGNDSAHRCLPFAAVHYADDFCNSDSGQHGDTSLPAEAVFRLDDHFHAVDFANGIVKAVRAVLVHLDNAAGYV